MPFARCQLPVGNSRTVGQSTQLVTCNSKNCYRQLNKIIKLSAQCFQNGFKFSIYALSLMSTFMQQIYLYPVDTWVWTLFNPLHRSYAQSQNKTESEGSIIIITKACRLIPCHRHCCQSLDESHCRAPVSIFTLMKPMKLCIILMGPWQKCRRQRRRKLHFSATLKWGADS